jgi:hypothetical protein
MVVSRASTRDSRVLSAVIFADSSARRSRSMPRSSDSLTSVSRMAQTCGSVKPRSVRARMRLRRGSWFAS